MVPHISSTDDSWGNLKSVTLPTGGVEQFGYSIVAGSLDNATQIRLPNSYTPGATTTAKSFTNQFTGTSSSYDLAFQVTVQNPVEADGSGGGSVVYKYNDLNGSLWNSERDFSDANGTLLRSEVFGYQGFFCGFTPNSHTVNLFDTTGANPITSKSVVSYDNGSNWNNCPGAYTGNSLGARATARPVSVSEYDYGGSTPVRTTYYHWSEEDANYWTAGNAGLLKSAVVVAGSADPTVCANIVAGRQHIYDTASLTPQTGDSYHDYSFANLRGNANETDVYLTSACQWQTQSTMSYDELGNMVQTKDALRNPTTIAYAPNSSYAFMMSSTNALGQTTQYSYDSQTGLLNSSEDPNSATTSYTYDVMRRPSTVSYPDLGSTTFSYPDANTTNVTQAMTSTTSKITSTETDGFGRTVLSSIDSDPAGADQVQTSYNYNGRPQTTSNAYRGTSPPAGSSTSYVYDALGRMKQQVQPDGNLLTWTFSQNVTDSYDEAGVHWQRTNDALGRMTKVMELGTAANPLNLTTNYIYSVLGNLTSVNQLGNPANGDVARTRTFTYDSLSRLLTSGNPETGTICYGQWSGSICVNGYDLNSNLIAKTDANQITTNYTYDALNRLSTSTSSDGSVNDIYVYDDPTPGNNGIGRLMFSGDAYAGVLFRNDGQQYNGASQFTYDPLGRVSSVADYSVDDNAFMSPISLKNDLAGNAKTIKYPDGRIIAQTFDSAGHVTVITDQSTGVNYLANATYSPSGAVSSMTFGNGATQTITYNSRLQQCENSVSSPFRAYPLLYSTSSRFMVPKACVAHLLITMAI